MNLALKGAVLIFTLMVAVSCSDASGPIETSPLPSPTGLSPVMTITINPSLTASATEAPDSSPTPTQPSDQLSSQMMIPGGSVVDWSPSDELLAISSNSGLSILSAADLEEVYSQELEASINKLSFSPGGNELAAIGESDPPLLVWGIPGFEPKDFLESFPSKLIKMKYGANGELLLLAHTGPGETLILIEIDTNAAEINTASFQPEIPISRQIDIAPEGNKAMVESESGFEIWMTGSGDPIVHFNADNIWELYYGPVPDLIGTVHTNCEIKVWQETSPEPVHVFNYCSSPPPGDFQSGLTFSGDGSKLAIANYEGNLFVWDLDSGQMAADLNIPKRNRNSIAFNADASSVASIGDGGLLQIWDISE